jgi:hypothetical protein
MRIVFILFIITYSLQTSAQNKTEVWDFIELTFQGDNTPDAFRDTPLSAQFQNNDKLFKVDGFYDGNGKYKIRFMPDRIGVWRYHISSRQKKLNGKSGEFEAVPATKNNHGPVKVAHEVHFSYSDNTPFVPVGTTCYAWVHQDDKLQEQTLQTLRASPFNKLRMTIFPKWYDHNRKEPAVYPYAKDKNGNWDFNVFNPEFFQRIEKRILDLRSMNIEADLILFHPYDEGHWGFDRMGKEANHRYLKYVIARFAAIRNVWWSMANEYDFVKSIKDNEWEELFLNVRQNDPYGHLCSIHNGQVTALFDHHKPYISHVSIQHHDLKRAPEWKKYGKPVINDECEYEGNTWQPWGNISAKELVHRAWLGYGYGIYVGHGETFVDSTKVLWWSHGGILKGESAPRLDFMKKFMMDTSPSGLNTFDPESWLWLRFSGGKTKDGTFFYYFAEHQPGAWLFYQGDAGKVYEAEVIDTWNMTITKVPGQFRKGSSIPMPARSHLALRLREVRE